MFQVLETISDAGDADKPNEDAFGYGDAHAWVIDGATGVADSELMGGASDAQWFAQSASVIFAEQMIQYGDDLKGLTRRTVETLRARFEAQRSRPLNGRYELPSAAMTLMHCGEAYITCVNFADCRLVLAGDDGDVKVLGDHHDDREPASRKRTAALLEKLGPDSDPFEDPDVMRFLRRARDYQNRADGYWIFGLDPVAVNHMRCWKIPLAKPMTGLLMSDGFVSLTYDYNRLSIADLISRAGSDGLENIVKLIRQVERKDDPEMKLYPRFKRSDDATAILFRVAPNDA